MTGRIYLNESEFQERARRRNERRRAFSGMFNNSAIALGGCAVAEVHGKGWSAGREVVWWFLIAAALILASVIWLNFIEAES